MDDYTVELEEFAGPLDLLLFLIQREEVGIESFPLSRVTEHFLGYVERLPEIDLDRIGDYLVLASQLIAMKARALLPAEGGVSEKGGRGDEVRQRLIRELLAYRLLKEQTRTLAQVEAVAGRRFRRRHPRTLEDLGLKHVDVWDLLTSYQHLLSQLAPAPESCEIESDELPLEQYVERLRERLGGLGGAVRLRLSALFAGSAGRRELVATFLALLELIRLGEAHASQGEPFGEIEIGAAEPSGRGRGEGRESEGS